MRKLIITLMAVWALSLTGCSGYYWNRAQFEMRGDPFFTGKEIIAESVAEKDSLRAEARISTLAGQGKFSINAKGSNEIHIVDGERQFHYRNTPDYYGHYGSYGYRSPYGYYGSYGYRGYSGHYGYSYSRPVGGIRPAPAGYRGGYSEPYRIVRPLEGIRPAPAGY